MTTLSELKSELAKVDQLLYATWLREREDVRRRIAAMAVEFQLSPSLVAADIEAALNHAEPRAPTMRAPRVEIPLRRHDAPLHVEIKYRNPATGDYWKGRGPRPRWLRDALDAGALLEDFLVQGPHGAEVTDPLREFQDAARRTRLNVKV